MIGTAGEYTTRFLASIPKAPKRTTLTAKQRKAVADEKVAMLQEVLADIRRKARETPAWAHGLNAAATSVELQIAAIKGA